MTDEDILDRFLAELDIPEFTSLSPVEGINALSELRDVKDSRYTLAIGLYGESLRGDFEVIESITRLLNFDKYGDDNYESEDFSERINSYFDLENLGDEPDFFDLAANVVNEAEERNEVYTGSYSSTSESS